MPRKIYNENGSGKCSLNCTYNNPKQHVEKDDGDNKRIDKTTMTKMLAILMTTLTTEFRFYVQAEVKVTQAAHMDELVNSDTRIILLYSTKVDINLSITTINYTAIMIFITWWSTTVTNTSNNNFFTTTNITNKQ